MQTEKRQGDSGENDVREKKEIYCLGKENIDERRGLEKKRV